MPAAAQHEPLPEEDELLGRTVGKYNLVKLLGVGGMGRVYEGAHETLGKRFALKFIDRESATPEAVQRFQREAQAASAVDSAHIVDIFDVGTSDQGLPYIVMELLRGEDLGHRIRRLGRLELGEALRIVAHVLRGLARAHEAGIVHRDLKPDNVFLVERDDDPCFAKVLDFGVSKIQRRDASTKTITREGVVLGTPVYMSPEQAQALPDVDQRSDLWAVGAILYECLAGAPPFSGATYEAVIVGICTRDPDDVRLHNPEVPEGIANVIKSAMIRDKEHRYGSAREMLDALVTESEGVLPTSLKSDSLKRVGRAQSSGGVIVGKGAPSLAAVSTVAATPPPNTGSKADAPSASRAYLAVGAAAIAIGGIVAGIWLASESSSKAVGSSQPQMIVVQAPGATTTVVVTAVAPPIVSTVFVEVAPSANLASASAAPAASASASATTKPRPVIVRPRVSVEVKTPPPPPASSKTGVGGDLQLKRP